MKYKLVLLLFFINLNSLLFSQEFRDKVSNEKISFVEIYSDKGNLIGITDVDGLLSIDLKNKIMASNSMYLTFVNSFFENEVIGIDDFYDGAVFKMNPIVNELKEIVISPKKDKNQYLVLKTYVRSLQINNNKIHYFMDGIVEYYISLKTNKVKIKFLSNRSFENKSISQLKEKGLAKIYFQIIGAPIINEFLNYNNLQENYNFQKAETEIKIITKEDNSLKGNFFTNESGANLSLGIITNDKPKVMKGLGLENILNNFNIKSHFNTTAFEEIGINTLFYFKETRNYEIKAKKDKEYQKVDVIHEVFVLDYRFSERIDAKKMDNNYSFINSSSYTEKYWENVENQLFQPLPKSLELYIQENLTEIKK
ncbi:hypothetical protein ACFX5F_13735 [Flavobacterium sp. ZS1P70]|uniref:Uncharacterized protein n=1 Tax=Flavobacterium zhoui TaxID=3230414 RepID=A0ABW6I7W7_9FLAO